MLEKKSIHPIEQIYLENLFETSNKFYDDISELRKKYKWIKFRSDFEIIINIDDNKDYADFFNDIEKMLEKYNLKKYKKDFIRFVITKIFPPLIKNNILFDKDWIKIVLDYQVTKKEFMDLWDDVKAIREIWKNAFYWRNIELRKRKKLNRDFDTKIAYYRHIHEWYPLEHYESVQIDHMEPIQKEMRLKEVNEWLNYLNKS